LKKFLLQYFEEIKMADYDLTTLDETKPDGATEEVSVLDDYQRETRLKLKAWAGIEHDLVTGAHIIPYGAAPPIGTGRLYYDTAQRELCVGDGVAARSVVQPTYNYLINGTFNQFWSNPTLTFSGWTFGGTNATLARVPGFYANGSARIRAITDFAVLGQTIASSSFTTYPFGPYNYWRGKTVTFGAFVRAQTINTGYLRIYDGLTFSNSLYHVGDDVWRWITVTKVIDPAATAVRVEFVSVDLGGGNARISGATLVEGHSCPHPLPQSWQGRQGALHFGHSDALPNTNTPWWYGVGGHGTAPAGVQNFLPFDASVYGFYVHSGAVAGAGTFTAQIENNGTLTPLLVTLTGAVRTGSDVVDTYMGAKGTGWSAKVIRNGGNSSGFASSLFYDEVPVMP
jgi:hypothetical protein